MLDANENWPAPLPLWAPQLGPQADAIACDWCPEILYGGAAGGGKSDFLLGDFLQDVPTYGQAWRGVLFRRTYPELEELLSRAHEIYPASGATWQEQKKLWTWPNNAVLRLRYLESDLDALRYQGHQYCVAVETMILMADGTSRRIDEIEIGDVVATLEGPRKVTATVKPYLAPCVRTSAGQVHPIWHPILTDGGWQSFASVVGIGATTSAAECQAQLSRRAVRVTAKLARRVPATGIRGRAAKQSEVAYMRRAPSAEMNQASGRLPLWCTQGQPPSRASVRQTQDRSLFDALHAQQAGGCYGSEVRLGSQGRYSTDTRRHGAQPHSAEETGRREAQTQDDAASRSHERSWLDVPGNTPSRSRRIEDGYLHPYDGQVYATEWESSEVALEMTYVGERLVADITVDGANHYITADTGVVNKNTWIGWDELTQWPTSYAYKYLRTRLRSAFKVPTKRIRSAANPGGPGHAWVKEYFIDPAPSGMEPIVDADTETERMFIPARLRDNAILVNNDPEYAKRLKGAGSKALVDALLAGDWSVIEGAFFDCWSINRHVVRPFAIPEGWSRFKSCDWGSAKPFSVGWWAVASDDYQVESITGDRIVIPRGAMVRYREWYGCSAPNVGLKLFAEQVAKGIREREDANENTDIGVIDPAAFQQNGGPSIAERMGNEGVYWNAADNSRVGARGAMGGWDQMRGRLVGDGDGRPMIYAFSTCEHSIRTIPILQHDPKKPEDLQTDGEDHAADEWRYACMSRPYTRDAVTTTEDTDDDYRTTRKPKGNSWMTA